MTAISIKNLWKFYNPPLSWGDIIKFKFRSKSVLALKNINLEIKKNSITGIVGQNGAGKTSLLKIIGSISLPSKGDCEVFGHSVISNGREVRKLIGYCFSEERSFFWRLSGRENLSFFASLYGFSKKESDEKINELLEILEMKEEANSLILSYSTGMRQRLSIARALLCEPKILIFDEISKGLDPRFQKKILKLIREDFLEKRKTTILIASHNLLEIEQICDEIIALHKGEIFAMGKMNEIKGRIDEIFEISY